MLPPGKPEQNVCYRQAGEGSEWNESSSEDPTQQRIVDDSWEIALALEF
jgi:hypothetical protein